MSNQPTRQRLIAKIIDVGMLRRDVATDIADAILKDVFQRVGWAEPGEFPSEVHEDVVEFATDHHSAAGDQVLELMPVYVGQPVWGVVADYGAGDDYSHSDVSLHDTRADADKQHAKNEAEIAVEAAS